MKPKLTRSECFAHSVEPRIPQRGSVPVAEGTTPSYGSWAIVALDGRNLLLDEHAQSGALCPIPEVVATVRMIILMFAFESIEYSDGGYKGPRQLFQSFIAQPVSD